MVKTCRRSSILMYADTSISPGRFRKDNTDLLWSQLEEWSSLPKPCRQNTHKWLISEIINPKQFIRDFSIRTADKLLKDAANLIATQYPPSKNIKYHFGKRRHVHPIDSLSSFLSGFDVQKGYVRRLELRLEKIVHSTFQNIQLIESVEKCNGSLTLLSEMMEFSPREIACKIKNLVEKNTVFNGRVTKLLKLFSLAQTVQEITKDRKLPFRTLKCLENEIRACKPQLIFSISSLYRVFKMSGFRWKKNISRKSQTGKAKDARCHFMREYVRAL